MQPVKQNTSYHWIKKDKRLPTKDKSHIHLKPLTPAMVLIFILTNLSLESILCFNLALFIIIVMQYFCVRLKRATTDWIFHHVQVVFLANVWSRFTSFMSNYLISCSVVIYIVLLCIKRFITSLKMVSDVVTGDKS